MVAFPVSIVPISTDKTAFPTAFGLRDGGFVFVRVLASSPDGKALVSFAGQQFEVQSLRNVAAGTAFKAQIKLDGNTVLLVPQTNSSFEAFSRVSAENLMQPQNAAFFASLGLPADFLVFSLLQQLQQSGLKINTAHVLKARKAARAFPQNEDEAAESALLLLEKGIEPEPALVAQVLQLLYGGGAFQKGEEGNNVKSEQQDGKNIFLNALYENTESLIKLPTGLLTLINHLKTGSSHWIVLPYEYSVETAVLSGTIRLLCDTERQTCEKMAVSIATPTESWYFFVQFTAQTINNHESTLKKSKIHIYYCCEPQLPKTERQKYADALNALFEHYDCAVQYCESLAGRSFFVPDIPLCSVQMEI